MAITLANRRGPTCICAICAKKMKVVRNANQQSMITAFLSHDEANIYFNSC